VTVFLIDTDTAGDDVPSLLFGLRWSGVDLAAITVAAGNVYLHEAVRNALYTTEVAGRPDVGVYAGASRPLLRPLVTAHYVHGDDGMGNSGFPDPTVRARPEHAVDAIVAAAERHAGELEIIAQAPLTNIALALMRDAGLPDKVRRLWIMGGANSHVGNITPAAEFNFYVDPEAAHIVLSGGFEVTLVPWDVCLEDGVLLRDELGPVIDSRTEFSGFYLAVNRAAWEFMRSHPEGPGIDGITHPDSLTMAMAIDRRVIASSERYFVDVEHRGALTSGYSLVDRHRVLGRRPDGTTVIRAAEPGDVEPLAANAEVVTKARKDLFKEMLFRLLLE
jgi:inosine-uridine nucleoside N-ribohydrolase